MNAIEIAELLEYSAIGNLGDFSYVADAAKELRRLAGVEAELVALREQKPVAWQSAFSPYHDWSFCSKEHAEWVRREPQEFIGYETRALYADPVLSAQALTSEIVAPSWVYLESGRNDWDSAEEYANEGNLRIGDEFTLGAHYHHKAKFKVKDIDEDKRCVIEQIEGQLYCLSAPPAQPSGNPEQLLDWPEDRGEHPQKGLEVDL